MSHFFIGMQLYSLILLASSSLTSGFQSRSNQLIDNTLTADHFSVSDVSSRLDSRDQSADVACPRIQYEFDYTAGAQEELRDSVKRAFQVAWLDYAENCLGHDSVDVENGTCVDDYNGWGASIFDALDTATIMGLSDIVAQQLGYIAQAKFTKSIYSLADLSAFETTIRYLGGLLSAYDLLKSGEFDSDLYDSEHVEALLTQATVLGELLARRFRTRSGLPANGIDLYTGM